jgi:hypothetical protein
MSKHPPMPPLPPPPMPPLIAQAIRRSKQYPPAPGEAVVIKRHCRVIDLYSLRVIYPHRLGMDINDVRSDLRISLLTATRKHHEINRELLPPQLGQTVIKRRVIKLNRFARAKFRTLMDTDEVEGAIEVVAGESTPDTIESTERHQFLSEVVYALRRNLDEASFATLWLRYGEDLMPNEIVGAVAGVDQDTAVLRKRLLRAKERARDFLATLGMTDVTDLEP